MVIRHSSTLLIDRKDSANAESNPPELNIEADHASTHRGATCLSAVKQFTDGNAKRFRDVKQPFKQQTSTTMLYVDEDVSTHAARKSQSLLRQTSPLSESLYPRPHCCAMFCPLRRSFRFNLRRAGGHPIQVVASKRISLPY